MSILWIEIRSNSSEVGLRPHANPLEKPRNVRNVFLRNNKARTILTNLMRGLLLPVYNANPIWSSYGGVSVWLVTGNG